LANKHPKVFGTFGVEYDPSEFEKIVADSPYYNVNLLPDCRVFVFGTEITKDILSVTVNNAVNSIGTCQIQLANPRGKYVIQRNDLRKKSNGDFGWREDKDILASYTYKQFERMSPGNILQDLVKYAAGNSGAEAISAFNKAKDLITGTFANPHAPTTRMIFETKFYSGINKCVGDIVFDYRDPVIVFFKGRFSPYWYFGFSGVVAGYDENMEYGGTQTITLSCENTLHLWSKQRLLERSSMLPAGRYEYAHTSSVNKVSGTEQSFNIKNTTSLSFNKYIQFCAFGWTDLSTVHNTNLILNNIKQKDMDTNSEAMVSGEVTDAIKQLENSNKIDYFLWSMSTDTSNNSILLATRERIRQIYFNCKMWGNSNSLLTRTLDTNKYAETKYQASAILDFMCSADKIIGKIPHPMGLGSPDQSGYTTNGPNSQKLSTWQSLYLQYFKIAPQVLKTQNEIPKWYEASLRFWEYNPTLPVNKSDKINSKTGWVDGSYFCVAGSHPAMKYEFLNNFNMLSNIWVQQYLNPTIVDSLVVSPADKIREIISGSPTEYREDASSESHANFFRPRLFMLLPRRFNSEKSADAGKFLDFSLFETQGTNTFDAVLTMCKKLDYYVYANQMGDICIEPELYDTHPKIYMEPQQYTNYYTELPNRSLITNSTPLTSTILNEDIDPSVTYRTPGSSDFTKTSKDSKLVSWFGERSTHPLTIMNKDIFKITQTFLASQMATSVTVTGMITATTLQANGETGLDIAGGTASVEAEFQSQSKSAKEMQILQRQFGLVDNNLASKAYVADGMDTKFFLLQGTTSDSFKVSADRSLLELKKSVISYLCTENPESALSKVLIDVADTIYNQYYITSLEEDIKNNFLYRNIFKIFDDGDQIDDQKNVDTGTKTKKKYSLNSSSLPFMTEDDSISLDNSIKLSNLIYDLKKSYIMTFYTYLNKKLYPISPTDESYEGDLAVSNADVLLAENNLNEINYLLANFNLTSEDPQYIDLLNQKNKALKDVLDKTVTLTNAQILFDEAEADAWSSGIENIITKNKIDYYNTTISMTLQILSPGLFEFTDFSTSKNTKLKVKMTSLNIDPDAATMKQLFGTSSDPDEASFLNSYLGATSENTISLKTDSIISVLNTSFMALFRDYVLCQNLETQVIYNEYANSIKMSNASNSGGFSIRTIADLKLLEQKGFYNPKRDLMRLYGYNPAPPKVFLYVANNEAAQHYAMMYMNQFLGKAFTISCSMIGRPEFQLNRPHYIKAKDAIGLSTQYSLSYSYGSNFSTNATFSYIRKNAISYNYTMGNTDTLPYINEKPSQNVNFSDLASNFYKDLNSTQIKKNVANAANSAIGTPIDPSLINTQLSQTKNNISKGLFSFHDEIGQIDFDKRMSEEGTEYKALAGSQQPSGINPFDSSEVRAACISIDTAHTDFSNNCERSRQNKRTIIELQNSIKVLKSTLGSIQSPTTDSSFFIYRADGLDMTENEPLTLYTGPTVGATCSILFNSGDGVTYSSNVVNPNYVDSWPPVTAVALIHLNGLSDLIYDFEVKPKATPSIRKTWVDLVANLKSFCASNQILCQETIVGGKLTKITFTSETILHNYPGNNFLTIDTIEQMSQSSSVPADYIEYFNVFSQVTPSARAAMDVSRIDVSAPLNGTYGFNLSRTSQQGSVQSTKGSLQLSDITTWGELISKFNEVSAPVYICRLIDGIVEFKPSTELDSSGNAYKIYTEKYHGQNNNLQDIFESIISVGQSESGFKFSPYLVNTHILQYTNNRKKVLTNSISEQTKHIESLDIDNNRLISNCDKLQKELIGGMNLSTIISIMDNANYDGKDHMDILDTWSIDYFETKKDPIVKTLKQSLFAQLLLTTYKVTGLYTWKLLYTPTSQHGQYNKDPIYGYIISDSQIKPKKDPVLKKYIWLASETGSETDENSLLFNIGKPDQDQIKQIDIIYNKWTTNSNPTPSDLAKYDFEMRQYLVANIFTQNGIEKLENFITDYNTNYQGKNIDIYGFTCTIGSEDYNQGLSERRARCIGEVLAAGLVLPDFGYRAVYRGNILHTLGFGLDSEFIIATPSTDPKNRRVELWVTDPVKTKETYTVWEDWNTPVTLRSGQNKSNPLETGNF
jgi:hypothetical protein